MNNNIFLRKNEISTDTELHHLNNMHKSTSLQNPSKANERLRFCI